MYTLLALFFVSLISIMIMIGKKLVLLKNGQLVMEEQIVFSAQQIEKVKQVFAQNTKKYGHIALVSVLRFYIKSSTMLKNGYKELRENIKNRMMKSVSENEEGGQHESSKFLKKILDYKHKIREIKEQIHEEENF